MPPPSLRRALGALALFLALDAVLWAREENRASPPAPTREVAGASSGAPVSVSTPEPATSKPADPDRAGSSFLAAAIWFLALYGIGLAALPLAFLLFPYLKDRGVGFAKIFGLALSTFCSSLLVRYHLIHQGAVVSWIGLVLVAAAGVLLLGARRRRLLEFLRENRGALLAGEAMFVLGFVLFLLFRSFNPEISWGEKPMDFSILNILVRSRTIPSSDPWFAGAPLGYYVFGQQMIAFLTLLTQLSTRFTFNLAFGLLGGTIAQGAFCLARDWAGRARAGFAGAAFTLLFGNLAGLREWLINQRLRGDVRRLDWHYFWATSRVVPDTINEYPLWSLLFADLHAHVLALPLFLLVLASALQLVRSHADPDSRIGRRLLCALVLGFAAAVQASTNAWDIPLLAGLLGLLFGLTLLPAPRFGFGALLRAAVSTIVAGSAAFLFLRPLWVRGGGLPGWGRNMERGARGVDVLTCFGLFFFLCLAWWAVSASTRLARRGFRRVPRLLVYTLAALVLAAGFRSAEALCLGGLALFLLAIFGMAESAEDRLAFGLVATAFFLVLFPQRFFIYDRMNTFFKLYFEAWPLFALGSAVLVFGSANRPGAFEQWPRILRVVFFLLLACALFTTVTAIRGSLFGGGNPSRHGAVETPSLDGLRYLEKMRPGEYRAVLWLRRSVTGTPVILEAQGDSYGDFSRVSMLTGLPTVLGWEHHVKQRGNPEMEVEARRQAIRAIYSSTDLAQVEPLLRRYHVGYIYVGFLERREYPQPGLAKFDLNSRLFENVYTNPEVKIYRVVGGDSQDVLAPVRESIPPTPVPEAAAGDEPERPPVIRDKASPGSAPFSGMKEPRGAAVDEQGRIWIADFGHSRLRIFDPLGGLLGGWGGRGNGLHGFRELCGVAIRGSDVYVADTWNSRVQAFSLDGVWRATAGDLFGPRGVAVSSDGTVWVTDTGNKRVVSYDRSLKHLQTIGRLGPGPAEFSDPVGIAAGPDGLLYVADAGNGRIQVLNAGGRFVRQIAVPNWKMGIEPHLEVDENGTIYATDPLGNALLELSPSGSLVRRILRGDDGAEFSRPTGVAIDRKNRLIYVIDSGSNTVSKLKLPAGKLP